MTTDKIAQNMEVIGADGVHVAVDGVANGRIRLAKRDSGEGRAHTSTSRWSLTSRGRGFVFLRTRLWR
jgi:hypothetical protein